jgi:hypothetical protein
MASATTFFQDLRRALSVPRFDSYCQEGGGEQTGLQKYLWNTALCESLYPTLQILEVAFRNATHAAISKTLGDDQWLMKGGVFLYAPEKEKIAGAVESLKSHNKVQNEPVLVAELSFGFWTSLLDSRYETMWHRIIKSVFPNMPNHDRTRKTASSRMNLVRKLRNAALHHHSIWHWADLKDQHAQAQILIAWLCASSAKIAGVLDRFPSVFAGGYAAFTNVAAAISR